jgi:hypothetical protein
VVYCGGTCHLRSHPTIVLKSFKDKGVVKTKYLGTREISEDVKGLKLAE